MKKIIVLVLFMFIFGSCEKKQIKQNESYKTENDIIENNNTMQIIESEDSGKNILLEWDDTIYDDKATIEFSLCNNDEEVFCLYHNIRKIPNINLENYLEIQYWCKKTINDLDVTWNYENGAILNLATESEKYKTKRGIKVGDPLSKVKELYAKDSDVYNWNYENDSFEKESNINNNLFSLYCSEEGCSIDAANLIDEEIMTIIFYAKEDNIYKIEILCGN